MGVVVIQFRDRSPDQEFRVLSARQDDAHGAICVQEWQPVPKQGNLHDLSCWIHKGLDELLQEREPLLIRFEDSTEGEVPVGLQLWDLHAKFKKGRRLAFGHIAEKNAIAVHCRRGLQQTQWDGKVVFVQAADLAEKCSFGRNSRNYTLDEALRSSSEMNGALVVVGRISARRGAEEELARLAKYNCAALLIWLEHRGDLFPDSAAEKNWEIRATSEIAYGPQAHKWLSKFVAYLRAASTPADSLRQAIHCCIAEGCVGLASALWLRQGDDDQLWLPRLPPSLIPTTWRSRVDRFAQRAMVAELRRNLVLPHAMTEVQVILSLGSDEAGIDGFVAGICSEEDEPPYFVDWAEDIDCQFEQLAERLPGRSAHGQRARSPEQMLLEKLVALGDARNRARHLDSGSRKLVAVEYGVYRVAESRGIAVLREHLGALCRLSGLLAEESSWDCCLCVHVPVAQDGTYAFSDLRRLALDVSSGIFSVAILPELSLHVPTEELDFWLDAYGLAAPDLPEDARTVSYARLLDMLNKCYNLDPNI